MDVNFVPVNVINYLKSRLLDKKEPRQVAIDRAYTHWEGVWRGMGWQKFPDEKEARRLLEIEADKLMQKV